MAIEGTLELENGNGGIKNGENLVDADEDDAGVSVEMTFSDIMIPSWKEQLTFRAFVVSAMLGVMLSLCQDLDKGVGAVWDVEASIYETGEYGNPNVCCCYFRGRI
ncbi:hypothetical protein E3N88_17083 [Mikania micrantha]|uniref:Uncharacterized protein n=1 Tax=Mikania micrantha TaxID=192012 RepID=A0A5N6NTU6_9ASTR|nr:hypothetical protein E3N88_17083 [Mikania micrantha]